jgi:4-diphosphocytidyl-2-C-methyl-D-erythritol kinase
MLEIVANAKVNLFLEITGKLSNGYHTVDTVMQSVSLADTIKIDWAGKNSGIKIICSDPGVPTDERNIAYKTARDYLSVADVDSGVSIEINKLIPSQAGMGGGSADGAAVLVGLNHLCGNILSINQLKEIASKYGADIPFCIDGGTQRLIGIGTVPIERFESPKIPIVIIKPKSGISTPAAYGLLDSIHNNFVDHLCVDPTNMLNKLREARYEDISSSVFNRFEEVLNSLCVESLDIISWLKNCGYRALLSGSGSAIFCIADDYKEAYKLDRIVAKRFPNCYTCVCETTNRGCEY